MKDVKCPYCNTEQDINHDDGYGYEEGVIHNQQCGRCSKYFSFTTSVSFYYDVDKADCLNGAPHKWRPTKTYPIEYAKMKCLDCGETRSPTKEEMEEVLTPKLTNETTNS
jgi:hypothetical protein